MLHSLFGLESGKGDGEERNWRKQKGMQLHINCKFLYCSFRIQCDNCDIHSSFILNIIAEAKMKNVNILCRHVGVHYIFW